MEKTDPTEIVKEKITVEEKKVEENKGEEKKEDVTQKKKVILLSIDIEATGLSKHKDTTIEVGIDIVLAETDGNILTIVKELPSFQQYTCGREGIQICGEAAEITGLSREFIAGQKPLDLLFTNCVAHLDDVCQSFPETERCLVAYNGNAYDVPMLVADAEKCFEAGGAKGFFRRLRIEKVIDVLHVARKHADETKLKRKANGRCSYKLGDVYRAITGDNLDGAHGAIADAKAVTRVIVESKGINAAIAAAFVVDADTDCETSKSLMTLVRASIKAFDEFYGNGKRKMSIIDVFKSQAKNKKKRHLLKPE
jgi:DNA polymerase III epsilon subunit-like protein